MSAWSGNNSSVVGPVGGGEPPTPLLADRIELVILMGLFAVGAPINLASFVTLRRRRTSISRGRLTLLRLHLNLADLLILFIYTSSLACWQLTYQWRGGDLLCKLMKFVNSTVFQLSSNIIVCVALDRMLTVLCTSVLYKRYFAQQTSYYVRLAVLGAWTLAAVVNLPQFFVWLDVAPFPNEPEWHQCVTIWSASRHFYRLANQNEDTSADADLVSSRMQTFLIDGTTYSMLHLASVFWIPAVAITVMYAVVIIYMCHWSTQKQLLAKQMKYSGSYVGVPPSCETGAWQMTTITTISHGNVQEVEDDCHLMERDTKDGRNNSVMTANSGVCLVPIAIHRMRNKTFRTSLLLVTVYLLCWSPYNVLSLWQLAHPSDKPYGSSLKFFNVLIVLNSVINPFLYGVINCNTVKRYFVKRKSFLY